MCWCLQWMKVFFLKNVDMWQGILWKLLPFDIHEIGLFSTLVQCIGWPNVFKKQFCSPAWSCAFKQISLYSRRPHVVIWQQWDLQDFSIVVHGLITWGGHCLPSDAMDLVKGMGPKHPVVSCANEQLQCQWLTLHVPMKLRGVRIHMLLKRNNNIESPRK